MRTYICDPVRLRLRHLYQVEVLQSYSQVPHSGGIRALWTHFIFFFFFFFFFFSASKVSNEATQVPPVTNCTCAEQTFLFFFFFFFLQPNTM